jgi:hypothetical protein
LRGIEASTVSGGLTSSFIRFPLRTGLARVGLARVEDLEAVKSYVARLPHPEELDVILVAYRGTNLRELRDLGWSLVGFDAGYFEAERSHFSVLVNEVLFAVYGELRAFASRPNRELLFSEFEDAAALTAEHYRAASEGKDVEHSPHSSPERGTHRGPRAERSEGVIK